MKLTSKRCLVAIVASCALVLAPAEKNDLNREVTPHKRSKPSGPFSESIQMASQPNHNLRFLPSPRVLKGDKGGGLRRRRELRNSFEADLSDTLTADSAESEERGCSQSSSSSRSGHKITVIVDDYHGSHSRSHGHHHHHHHHYHHHHNVAPSCDTSLEGIECCSDVDCGNGSSCEVVEGSPEENECVSSCTGNGCCPEPCQPGESCVANECVCDLSSSLGEVVCCADADCPNDHICQQGATPPENICICGPGVPATDCCIASQSCNATLDKILAGNVNEEEFKDFFRGYVFNEYMSLLENATLEGLHPHYNDSEMLARCVFYYMQGILPLPRYEQQIGSSGDRGDSRALQVVDQTAVRRLDVSEECVEAILLLAVNMLSAILAVLNFGNAQVFLGKLLGRNPFLKDKLVKFLFKEVGGDWTDEVGTIVSLLAVLLTATNWYDPWSEVVAAAKESFPWWDLGKALLNIAAIVALYVATPVTGGTSSAAATLVIAAKLAILSTAIVDLVVAFLDVHNDCLKDVAINVEDCDGFYKSGGKGNSFYTVNLRTSKGTLDLSYEMFRVPDKLEVIYEDQVIFTTGGLVSGRRDVQLAIDGNSKQLDVSITAPRSGTRWNFGVSCPCNNELPWIECCSDEDCSSGRACSSAHICTCDSALPTVDCCSDAECQGLGGGAVCVAEQCCRQDLDAGIGCCQDSDCDSASVCILKTHQCACNTLLPSVECCMDSDCIGLLSTCSIDSHTCSHPECDASLAECCQDSHCRYDEVCFHSTCLPKGAIRFTLLFISEEDTINLRVTDDARRTVFLGDPKADYNFFFEWDYLGFLTDRVLPAAPGSKQQVHIKSVAYGNLLSSSAACYEFQAESSSADTSWFVQVYVYEILQMTVIGRGVGVGNATSFCPEGGEGGLTQMPTTD